MKGKLLKGYQAGDRRKVHLDAYDMPVYSRAKGPASAKEILLSTIPAASMRFDTAIGKSTLLQRTPGGAISQNRVPFRW